MILVLSMLSTARVRLKPQIRYKIAVFSFRRYVRLTTKLSDIPRQHVRLMYDFNFEMCDIVRFLS